MAGDHVFRRLYKLDFTKGTTERLVCCFSSQKCKISSAIKLTFKIQNWFIASRCWLFATLHYRFIYLFVLFKFKFFPLVNLAYQSKPWPPIHANKSLFWLSVFFLNGLMRISLVIFVVGSFDWTLVVSPYKIYNRTQNSANFFVSFFFFVSFRRFFKFLSLWFFYMFGFWCMVFS